MASSAIATVLDKSGKAPTCTTSPPVRPQWREAVAGAGAGVFSRTAMAPLERLKLLKQLQTTVRTTAGAGAGVVVPNASVWKIFWLVYQEQGLYSFWRGNLPAVVRVAGTASINFTCMDYYKRLIVVVEPTTGPFALSPPPPAGSSSNKTQQQQERSQKFRTSLLAGGMAGATSTTIMYPFEFARTRLAMDMGNDSARTLFLASSSSSSSPSSCSSAATAATEKQTPRPREYRGTMDVLRKIVQSDGSLGLYRGYGIALVGGIFYRILYLGGYDILKYEMKQYEHNNTNMNTNNKIKNNHHQTRDSPTLSWTGRMVAAQTISLTAGTLSYPLDSVRRRMMMQSGVAAAAGDAPSSSPPPPRLLYRNSWQCMTHVWRTEGVAGFYLGLGPNMLRSVGGALLLVAYDAFRDLLS
ncbi:hypothetical protein ACA910_000455 [Epithemia clementina (nom. ined.)]